MLSHISYFKSIKAEWIKSRSFSVIGLIWFCITFVLVTVLVANYMDVYNRVAINTNPWDRYFIGGLAIYVLFTVSPFIILLTNAVIYIEEKANGWKFMYTMNVSRAQIYLSKLIVVLLLIFLASIVLPFLLYASGYIIDYLLPEYEFSYYNPNLSYIAKTISRALLASLGAIALQYMISIIVNNVILSLAIGIFIYIVAFILAFSDTAAVLYNPYALVMINQDFGAIDSSYKKDLIANWLTNVEGYSLFYFVLFTVIGCIYEEQRNIG